MNRRTEALRVVEDGQRFSPDHKGKTGFDEATSNEIAQRIQRPVSDEMLRLVHQVFLPHSEPSPAVVVFTSMANAATSTDTCTSVAEILARDSMRSVCLMDANLRSSLQPALLGAPGNYGLTDALTRIGPIRSFMSPVDLRANLWSLSCGTPEVDSPGLLASSSLRDRIAELREQFDYVLIDTPPVAHYADAIALGHLADGLILVIEAGVARRDETTSIVANLRASKIPILAAVLHEDHSEFLEKQSK
jgi:Mrp family chromosome partitioning ATPase